MNYYAVKVQNNLDSTKSNVKECIYICLFVYRFIILPKKKVGKPVLKWNSTVGLPLLK